jgi:uncharacterized protein YgbK (DUF1537 family)
MVEPIQSQTSADQDVNDQDVNAQNETPKIIVLDDDPTGSQTVHSCLLLMQWDVETLRLGIRDSAPIFFILTNTRSLPATEAAQVTREVCQNLKQAIALENLHNFLVVSRSDSTLRGHYPVETDAIAAGLGPFDAHFLIPAFFEGGRKTIESVHYLTINGVDTPVHQTEFARDSVFAYRHSYLPDYVAEKTQAAPDPGDRIVSSQVTRFLLPEIRTGVLDRLLQLHHNQCCVVDGEVQTDLDRFAQDLLAAAAQGKRFLFRSAASLLTALAQLPPQPQPPSQMHTYVRDRRGGAVIVGSHVQKTTEQLHHLLQQPGIVGIELDVRRILTGESAQMLAEASQQCHQAHQSGATPVVYTSRQELQFDDVPQRMQFGIAVSQLLMDIEQQLPPTLGFLISKGGITSNDTLSRGLNLRTARLLGQVLPGVSMVCTPEDHPQFPNLPVVLFPGNVGGPDAIALVYQRLSGV